MGITRRKLLGMLGVTPLALTVSLPKKVEAKVLGDETGLARYTPVSHSPYGEYIGYHYMWMSERRVKAALRNHSGWERVALGLYYTPPHRGALYLMRMPSKQFIEMVENRRRILDANGIYE